jgi:type II secretory pathway pseudopilin PulG
MRDGFTIIELLLAVLMFGFILRSASFIFQNQLLGNLESDGQLILARLNEAQARSMSTLGGVSWGIRFNNSSTPPSYSLFQGSSYVSASSTYYLSGSVEFQTPAVGTSTDVIFTKRSGTITATATIIIDLKGNTSSIKTITISPQGNISLQ